MINNNKILAHLLLIMALMMTHCQLKPQYSQTFIITSDTGYEREFKEEYDDDNFDFATMDSNDANDADDILDNVIPPLPSIEIDDLRYTTTHVYQKRKRQRPLLKLNITKIVPEFTFGVRRARNGTLHPTINMPSNSLGRQTRPPPPPVVPIIRPNQVEIISREKRPDEKFLGSSDVVMITPKSVVKKFASRSAKSSPRDADRIIFPNDFEQLVNTNNYGYPNAPTMDVRFSDGRFVPRGCRDGSSVCSNTDDYPVEHINKVIERNRARLSEFFGDDIVPQVVQRVDYPDEEPLCHSKEIVLYPTMGQTKDNKWAYIINNGNFSQGVRVEQCIGENRPCAFTESFPYGYITECKQKFIYRHLLALDENGETVKNLFRLPACCKCVIRSRYNGNIYSRHAAIDGAKTSVPETTTIASKTTST